MLIRVRAESGAYRVEIQENDQWGLFLSKVAESLKTQNFVLSRDPKGTQPLTSNTSSPVSSLQLKHGDMIFATAEKKEEPAADSATSSEPEIKQDPIDDELEREDGWIPQKRDPMLCKHGQHGKCTHCMPLPPWAILDIDPWKKDGIRFIPFHSYLRKKISSAGCNHPPTQKCLNCKSLDAPSYRVKPGATTLPSSSRLDSQEYRHVDHIEVESMETVDKFIQFWRETGQQRCGYLYGKYVKDPNIPLGIRAVVSAIYEPPQRIASGSLVLEEDPNNETVDNFANRFGLRKVGFIWTDLQVKDGKIIPSREKDAPLTSDEILRMAKMQNRFPSPCKNAISGYLGSKFVSLLVSGTEDGTIELYAYQVSDQCMSLVRDSVITNSKDPKLMRVKKLRDRVLPDVMYIATDEYGNQVLEKADPTMPLEYFIIKVSHGAPVDPNPLFKRNAFPIENRNKPQSLSIARQALSAPGSFAGNLSDFHLLLYLSKQTNEATTERISKFIVEGKGENEVRAELEELLKTTESPAAPQQNPREQELTDMLTAMGFTATQAREALWATNFSGVEAAIEFLSRG